MQTMAKKREAKDDVVVHGTTNVFADLGYKHADARQTKLRLAINRVFAKSATRIQKSS